MAVTQPQMPAMTNWRFEVDFERIGWLTIDTPNSPVNTLSRLALQELETVLKRVEDLAASGEVIGLVIQSGSRSARNLAERRAGTLLVVEPDAVFYVKLRALDGPLPVDGPAELGLGFFLLEVDQVLEDAAAEWEGGMAITAGIAYRPAPTLDEPWAQATLAALAAPRARA